MPRGKSQAPGRPKEGLSQCRGDDQAWDGPSGQSLGLQGKPETQLLVGNSDA